MHVLLDTIILAEQPLLTVLYLLCHALHKAGMLLIFPYALHSDVMRAPKYQQTHVHSLHLNGEHTEVSTACTLYGAHGATGEAL